MELESGRIQTFDKWWSKIGKKVLGRKLDAIKEVSTSSKRRSNTILVEIPLDNPTEYSLDKIREMMIRVVIINQTLDYIMSNYRYIWTHIY